MRKESTESSTGCRSEREGILVVAPNWLGDAVMATPFLMSLRKVFDRYTVSLYTRSYVSEIFRRCSALDELVVCDSKNPLKVFSTLRDRKPGNGWRFAFVLPNSYFSAITAFLSGAKERIGYAAETRDWLLTRSLEGGSKRDLHLSAVYIRMLESAAGVEIEDIPSPVVVPPYDWQKIKGRIVGGKDYFIIAPGAAYGEAKRWPLGSYREAALKIVESTNLWMVVVGSREESVMIEKGFKDFNADYINLAGKTGIPELMSIVRGASLLIGNDSGVSHISSAMGVPTVSIFGSSSPVWTAPRGPYSRCIYRSLPCSPCFKRECPDGDPVCLKDIGVDEVVDVSLRLLHDKESSDGKRRTDQD